MEPKHLNILLVEDDEIDIMNVHRAFRDSDIVDTIVDAEHGVEALEKLRGGECPMERLLILLDINLPRMDGIEFLRELREDDELNQLPVVVLTTSNDENDRVDAYQLNVAGYLLKPVTRERFSECMKSLERYWSIVEFP